MTTDKKLLVNFGKRIKQLRQNQHLSQEALAERCGLDRTYISSLERGNRNISLRNIALLAQAFDLSLADLFLGIPSDDS